MKKPFDPKEFLKMGAIEVPGSFTKDFIGFLEKMSNEMKEENDAEYVDAVKTSLEDGLEFVKLQAQIKTIKTVMAALSNLIEDFERDRSKWWDVIYKVYKLDKNDTHNMDLKTFMISTKVKKVDPTKRENPFKTVN